MTPTFGDVSVTTTVRYISIILVKMMLLHFQLILEISHSDELSIPILSPTVYNFEHAARQSIQFVADSNR